MKLTQSGPFWPFYILLSEIGVSGMVGFLFGQTGSWCFWNLNCLQSIHDSVVCKTMTSLCFLSSRKLGKKKAASRPVSNSFKSQRRIGRGWKEQSMPTVGIETDHLSFGNHFLRKASFHSLSIYILYLYGFLVSQELFRPTAWGDPIMTCSHRRTLSCAKWIKVDSLAFLWGDGFGKLPRDLQREDLWLADRYAQSKWHKSSYCNVSSILHTQHCSCNASLYVYCDPCRFCAQLLTPMLCSWRGSFCFPGGDAGELQVCQS